MDAEDLSGVVADRYVIEHRLGDGATCRVFAARDRVLDRSVALKVIRGPAGEAATDRLVREVRAMARLSHPNVISVFDAGVAASGQVYVAMELVDGVTLDRWSRARSADPAAVVAAFVAAGRGLAAARAAGLVHRAFEPADVMVGLDGRVCVLGFGLVRGNDVETDAGADQLGFCVALATALGGEVLDDGTLRLPTSVPGWLAPALRRGLAKRGDHRCATMDELLAALQPAAASRRRSRVGWVVAAVVALGLAALGIAHWRAPGTRGPAVTTPPARAGFRCGPGLETYAVTASGDSRGVRCVLPARDQDGTPWLAWYGEGVRDGVRYRQIGEGRLGGEASVVAVTDHGEGTGEPAEGTLNLGPANAGPRPPRVEIDGALHETWIRTTGTHADYTTAFDEPIRMCGPGLTRYRVFRTVEGLWGSAIVCLMPGGRTWLGTGTWNDMHHLHVGTTSFEHLARAPIAADLCNEQDAACGRVGHGELTIAPRWFPGVGDGLDLAGAWPEVWFPSTRRHALRIHVVRIVDPGARDAPPPVADLERAVRRANQLLAPSDIDVFFVAAEDGPDVTNLTEHAAASYQEQLRAAQPTTTLVLLRAGATGGCSWSPLHEVIALSLADDLVPGCARPWDDRLAYALVDSLGLSAMPDRPLPSWWLRIRRLE